jgi:hypothetical protein
VIPSSVLHLSDNSESEYWKW